MAEDFLESYTPTVEEEPTVEESNQMLSLDQGEDMKEVIKAALIDALKDKEAAKVLSEQIAVRIMNLNAEEEAENVTFLKFPHFPVKIGLFWGVGGVPEYFFLLES